MTKIFFDTEFTGLKQNTTLISIGCIAESGERFLGEFTDYDTDQLNDWLRENVISKLRLTGDEATPDYPKTMLIKGTDEQIADSLSIWFEQFEKVEMWSDCLAYDWVLFCELFGGAFGIPKNVYYIPFDICTLFKQKGIDPDISREDFAFSNAAVSDGKDNKHSALYDAAVIKACYDKLNEPGEIETLKAELEQSLLLYNNQTATIFKLEAENSKMRQALELAELELKAIYPRLGFRSSNVLDTVTKTLAEL